MLTTAALAGLLAAGSVLQAADQREAMPSPVTLEMGSPGNAMALSSNMLRFQEGQTYRLLVKNNSDVVHFFAPGDFPKAITTKRFEVKGGQAIALRGNVRTRSSFSRGSPHSITMKKIELRPGGTAEWVFVADKVGSYRFLCDIPAHAQAGMKGTMVIEKTGNAG
jgi:uncharacterized cupredoxin-like copper-binding protein